MRRAAYSYRSDASVPAFADDKPVIVFDSECILCSGWVRFLLRHDRRAQYRYLTAQSPIGQALYRHYGLDASRRKQPPDRGRRSPIQIRRIDPNARAAGPAMVAGECLPYSARCPSRPAL
ncbi:hypothetical protein BHMPCIPO_01142 [Ensifer sesbaniae]|nr:hypothetical protein [Ensifer sesbaniae]